MDARSIFRRVLDRYSGEHKKALELLWRKGEADGTLETTLYNILRDNAEDNDISISDAMARWETLADSDNEDHVKGYFGQTESNEDFISSIQQEVEGLPDEVKATLAESNSEKGEDTMTEMTEEEKRELMLKKTFPSMDPERQREDQQIRAEKFRAGQAERDAREAAARHKKRLYLLEQEIIKEQGPLDRTGLGEDYFARWLDKNPEFMKAKQEKWDQEDARNEAVQKEIQGRTLWD